jgi:DNA polymerase delta subunit 1
MAYSTSSHPYNAAHGQVKDNLGALSARFAALRISGGGLHLSRMRRDHSRQVGIKSVIQYRPNWVKNQQRMASTSNQETFRADIDGRLVFDILRQVNPLVSFSIAPSFCRILICITDMLFSFYVK